MTTALEIITAAARKIGVVRKGETLDNDEASEGLDELNRMLATWSNDTLLIYARTTESFTLTASATHTIGSGATLNTSKPVKIVDAYIQTSDGVDYPLTIYSQQEYNLIGLKNLSASPSDVLVYDNGHATGTITLYPVPAAGDKLYLTSEKPLTALASLATTVTLPPGYEDALVYNLAVRLAPEYGLPITQEVMSLARGTKGAIKRTVSRNRPIPYLPPRYGMRHNIYTGD